MFVCVSVGENDDVDDTVDVTDIVAVTEGVDDGTELVGGDMFEIVICTFAKLLFPTFIVPIVFIMSVPNAANGRFDNASARSRCANMITVVIVTRRKLEFDCRFRKREKFGFL